MTLSLDLLNARKCQKVTVYDLVMHYRRESLSVSVIY